METENRLYKTYDEYFEEYSSLVDKKGKKINKLPDKYVVVELSTTGLTPDICHIVEYGAIRYENGKETERFHTYAKMAQYFVEGIPGNTQIDFQNIEDTFEEKAGFS